MGDPFDLDALKGSRSRAETKIDEYEDRGDPVAAEVTRFVTGDALDLINEVERLERENGRLKVDVAALDREAQEYHDELIRAGSTPRDRRA